MIFSVLVFREMMSSSREIKDGSCLTKISTQPLIWLFDDFFSVSLETRIELMVGHSCEVFVRCSLSSNSSGTRQINFSLISAGVEASATKPGKSSLVATQTWASSSQNTVTVKFLFNINPQAAESFLVATLFRIVPMTAVLPECCRSSRFNSHGVEILISGIRCSPAGWKMTGTFVPIGDASGFVRWRNCRRPDGHTRLDTARRGLGTVDCRAAAHLRQCFLLFVVRQ